MAKDKPDTRTPFQRFSDLAQKVISAPKPPREDKKPKSPKPA